MFFRHLKNVLSRQDNSKTNLGCLKEVLIRLDNAFWIRLDLSDIDMSDIDLSDTDLDLPDKDNHNKDFVCLQDFLKASLRHVFKTSSRHVFKTSTIRLQGNNFCFPRRLQDVFKTYLQDVLEDEKLLCCKHFEDIFKTNKSLLGCNIKFETIF